jgi:hypothetical protein
MGRITRNLIVAPLATLLPLCAAGNDDARDDPFALSESLARGRFTLELRPRYNRIDQSDKPERTEGGTLRAVAGWRSAPWNGLRLTVEGIHAGHWGRKAFNDDGAQINTSRYPLLPDPRYTGMNEVHVEYAAAQGMRLRLGRQRVRLDNQRWVSDNDFRQIPQLFDGVTALYTGIENTELMGAHFNKVRTTSGTTAELKLTLLHAAWNPFPGHGLAAYGYFHDQAQNGAFTGFADSSYRVAGVRAEGSPARFGAVDATYVAEVAWQRPHAGGDARVHARYWRLGGGASADAWTLRYDYEVKGSNAGAYGLQMPLTDFYAFNGWTLHFFNTPRQGLRDQWLTGRASMGDFTLYGEAHRFRSDFGSLNFGREADVGVTWAIIPNAVLRLQHGKYDPGSGQVAPEIRKTWLTLTYTH